MLEKWRKEGALFCFVFGTGEKEKCSRILALRDNIHERDNQEASSIILASKFVRGDIAELLISKGANVNDKYKISSSPLHAASQDGHLNDALILLNKRAVFLKITRYSIHKSKTLRSKEKRQRDERSKIQY